MKYTQVKSKACLIVVHMRAHTCTRSDVLTKVDVQQRCVGSFHQDLLRRAVESLVHVVHPVSHHGLDPLHIVLKITRYCKDDNLMFLEMFFSV